MSNRTRKSGGPRPAIVLCAAALVTALLFAVPDTAGAAQLAPLPAAVQTGTAAWAVVPMGELSDPSNTFWQVLRGQPGSSQWSVVTPQGVADNGGLVLGAAAGSVVVGFLPSRLLHFSPVSASTDGGTTWNPVYLPGALSARPDSLAEGPAPAGALAIVGTDILRAAPGMTTWVRLASLSSLRRVNGSTRCQPGALDAVSFTPANAPLVATSCGRHGAVGLFTSSAGRWQDDGAALTGRLRTSSTTVLTLSSGKAGSAALVAAHAAGHTDLVALWQAAGGWRASAPLQLERGADVRSTASAASGGMTVLIGSKSHDLVDQIFPGGSWTTLPETPAGTVAVASTIPLTGDAAGTAEVFVVDGTELRVFALTPAGSKWTTVQTTPVSLAYGSSG